MIDVTFLVLVGVALAFLSLLVAIRMQSAGATAVQMVTVIAELWAVFATWIAVLSVVAGREGWRDFARRFGGLSSAGRALTVIAIAVSVGLFIHLQVTLRRAMHGSDKEAGEGDDGIEGGDA